MIERVKMTNPRRLAAFGVVAAVLVLLLAFWMRQVVYEVFVVPISYIFFVVGVLVDATPQIFFWLGSTALAFWIAYRAMNSGRRRAAFPLPTSGGALSDAPASTGRMVYWAVKVNMLQRYRSNYYQGGFHQALGRLLVETLAHRYRMTISEVEHRLRNDELDLPEEVREYARYVFHRPESTGISVMRQTWEDILEFLRIQLGIKNLNTNTPSARASRLVEPVIRYLQDELEVPHEYTRL